MNECAWDFSEDKKEILIYNPYPHIVMRISMYEVIDCSDPDFVENHIAEIKNVSWNVGTWKKKQERDFLKKLES